MTRVAVIGTGISGSSIARMLSAGHDVTVFEANDYFGGHANTVDVTISGTTFPVDTGFMVFNDRTYPNFCRMLDLLGIESQPSDMSFSVQCSSTGIEYQGSSLNGVFAQRQNCVRPTFLRMLVDIGRFNSRGRAAASSGELKDGRTVREFLKSISVSQTFIAQYLVPMAAAIWSSKPKAILDFPAEFMIGFFANHGLLQISDRPQWRTIMNGSRMYQNALLEPIHDRVRIGCPVTAVVRTNDGVELTPANGVPESFDHAVFATHADQTLRILKDATETERDVLAEFPYQPNEAVLHTDTGMLPSRRRAWASWNYHTAASTEHVASLTYDLSRLQSHKSATPILLTLNGSDRIEPSKVIRKLKYDHPHYSPTSLVAQARHSEISGAGRTHFCGAYWGFGFHEDGLNSALAVGRSFGIGLETISRNRSTILSSERQLGMRS